MKIGKFTIEEKIQPLVVALNNTPVVTTISSCQGHPGEYEIRQDQPDVPKPDLAHVIFIARKGIKPAEVEKFINFCLVWYHDLHGFTPIYLKATKNYIPTEINKKPNYVFEFQLIPFTSFESSMKKRSDLDRAIYQLSSIVDRYHISNESEDLDLPF